MPTSEGLRRARVAGFPPSADNHAQHVAAALEVMHICELVQFLSARGSFMEGAIVDAQIQGLAEDIRRVRGAETHADTLCGGYAALPANAAVLPMIRAAIHSARREYKFEEADSARNPGEDESKDLPSDTIDAMRAQLEFLIGGMKCPYTMHLSATLMTRMSRAAKKGSFFGPYVVHMRFSQLGGDRVAAVIAKAAGVTVEARFDDVPAADLPEVRLVADFLHFAWCRAYEAAAVYSTFDAPAALVKAKVHLCWEWHSG